ncbi:M3 family metallopeptidase [Ferrimonas aestuarii]|uniref:M3 family metallopeptidase n=1 Tax=Ferrimonas aestuarii TaxID=2569539 RepID=A0A4U1BMP6_9GAMM|nr:M3 family metallopeptidase [Ferrimonas aestuarii]TKB51997.1 M3 family metallopeptidase [Ferrimonas aestuarii]
MFRHSILAGAIVLSLAACSEQHATAPVNDSAQATETVAPAVMQLADTNPFKFESTLPYHAPNFTIIKDEHFKPAFEVGMAEHMAEIDAIANNPEPATFDNTIKAMEQSGEVLGRVSSVFFNLNGSDSNQLRRDLSTEMGPKLAEHSDNIHMNPKLFARVETLYNQRSGLGLDAESLRLLEISYDNFVRAGAKLDESQQKQVRALNKRLSELTNAFGQNLLASSKAIPVLVTDKAELSGLPEGQIHAAELAAEAAGKEGYLLTLTNTTRQGVLEQLDNRDLRERVWKASATRNTSGESDNRPIVKELVKLRAQKAELFGFNNWAEYKLQNQMAKKPEAVMDLLGSMAPKVTTNAMAEAQEIEKMIKAEGGNFKVEPWDWLYYAEKVRQQKFNIDQQEVAQYFEFDRVLEDGVFYTMNRLFGISFKKRPDIPAYHPDVVVYEMFNEDGSALGLFYADYFAREGKRGGAWMSNFVDQSHLNGNKPVVINVMNIEKAAPGQPQLVNYDEATTMFHEFGHGLHGAFSNVNYASLSGANTPRDFVEFPSTFQEDWAANPEVIANYAKHQETGQPIPDALLKKVLAANNFNQGFNTLEYLSAALLDMEWHSLPANAEIGDVEAFEAKALEKHGINLAAIPPRYKSAYFAHVFAGGYSAGYYAYMWSEILAADAFSYMGTKGGLSREQGQIFRDKILSVGNSKDLMEAYKDFRGQAPESTALLERRGIAL